MNLRTDQFSCALLSLRLLSTESPCGIANVHLKKTLTELLYSVLTNCCRFAGTVRLFVQQGIPAHAHSVLTATTFLPTTP
jgi:hypothetical protein